MKETMATKNSTELSSVVLIVQLNLYTAGRALFRNQAHHQLTNLYTWLIRFSNLIAAKPRCIPRTDKGSKISA